MPLEIRNSISDSSMQTEEWKFENQKLLNLLIKSQREIEELKKNHEIIQQLERKENENNQVKRKLFNKITQITDKLNQLKSEYNHQTGKLNVLRQELQVERAQRIKAEAFTKHWNFSNDFDYKEWEKSWMEIRNSLEFKNDLEELLFEYHKYVYLIDILERLERLILG